MANIGRESVASGTRALNSTWKGLRVTMPSAASAGVTITAYLFDTATGDGFRAFVLDPADIDGTPLAYSDTRTDISTATWYTFTGGTLASYAPGNGADIIIAICSNSGANATAQQDDAGLVGYAGFLDAIDPLNVSAGAADTARDYSIYMTYTEGGITDGPKLVQVRGNLRFS